MTNYKSAERELKGHRVCSAETIPQTMRCLLSRALKKTPASAFDLAQKLSVKIIIMSMDSIQEKTKKQNFISFLAQNCTV